MLKPIKLKAIPAYIAIVVFVTVLSFYLVRAGTAAPSDYSRLIEFIQLQDREAPLYIFGDYEEGFDSTSHKANLEYLNSHPGLIKKIRADLKGASLRWRLKRLQHRLLFVPEKRKEFAALYENYCKDVIRFILNKTNFKNPFYDVLTLTQERPELAPGTDGVIVFLVHNLAKEFQATNVFTSQKEKKAEIKLNGKIFIGTIGSYASQVEFLENGKVKFTRNTYSIWQNSADNPYTALMTPAEEALHALLRPYTEKAIEEKIVLLPQKTTTAVKAIADEWIAVEEAVAGGLVHKLLPLFFKKHIPAFPASLIEADLITKMKRKKYRYLRCGIDLVEDIGYKDFLNRYKSDPDALQQLLKDYRSL
ncbi:MAG: hypothetical protein MUP57_05010 [Clostridia bacterium]|nr:hypothetical protein [Clostridia bacterium]